MQGVFHNKAITFSGHPQYIDLILEMAKSKNVPNEELPKQVLVISDMEFDMAIGVLITGK